VPAATGARARSKSKGISGSIIVVIVVATLLAIKLGVLAVWYFCLRKRNIKTGRTQTHGSIVTRAQNHLGPKYPIAILTPKPPSDSYPTVVSGSPAPHYQNQAPYQQQPPPMQDQPGSNPFNPQQTSNHYPVHELPNDAAHQVELPAGTETRAELR
jgi:hypothetical protein